ncbi:hypothetical protein DFH11DRAFT_1614386 [Phellopilus nigrolimitatus]|nr:hypothetical protein DFH11DRAFT_1614386 [Phellopilus nigrolimitatus]
MKFVLFVALFGATRLFAFFLSLFARFNWKPQQPSHSRAYLESKPHTSWRQSDTALCLGQVYKCALRPQALSVHIPPNKVQHE